MVNILLCCNAGMSTSMVVKKMREAAAALNISAKIDAIALEEFSEKINDYDCCLLGPQVRFKLQEVQKVMDPLGKPAMVINSMDYGMMNGEKILKETLKALGQ